MIFIPYPWAALPVAAVFALLWRRRRKTVALVSALMWAAYGGYEYLMYARILCSGECNIRVDLLLIYPVLLGVSIASLVAALRGSRGRG
mgnify:FL=1